MTNELKPCPFCGGKVEEYVDVQGFRNYFCTKCPCSLAGDFEHYMTARKAWNSRADSTALAAAQEREARLIIQVSDLEHLARALCRQLPKDNVVRRQVLDYLAQHGLQAALSQPGQAPAQGEPAKQEGWRERFEKLRDTSVSVPLPSIWVVIDILESADGGWRKDWQITKELRELAAAPKEHDHD